MEHSHLAMMVARSCGSNVAKAHGAMVHVGLGSLGLGAQDLKPEFLGPGVSEEGTSQSGHVADEPSTMECTVAVRLA